MTLYLPVAAVVVASQGDPTGAVELLALASTHPGRATAWMECWPPLIQMRAELEAGLGPAAYQAAWARGQARDLSEVAASLLTRFQCEQESS